jgi:hypothetical protein
VANREIERRIPETGGNGCSNQVIISRIEQDYCRTQFAAGRLVEVDPNENDLTEAERH